MPIHLDAGDGWTYYTEEERRAMKQPVHNPAEWTTVRLPSDATERANLAVAAANSIQCAVVPLWLLDLVIAAVPHHLVCGKGLETLRGISDDAHAAIKFHNMSAAAATN